MGSFHGHPSSWGLLVALSGGSWRCGRSFERREQPTRVASASTLAARDLTPAAWPAAPRWPPPLLSHQPASFSTRSVGDGEGFGRGFASPLTDTLATLSTRLGTRILTRPSPIRPDSLLWASATHFLMANERLHNWTSRCSYSATISEKCDSSTQPR